MAMPLHLDGEASTRPMQEARGIKKREVPAAALRWQARRTVRPERRGRPIADGLAMCEPAPEMVRRMRGVVDDTDLVMDASPAVLADTAIGWFSGCPLPASLSREMLPDWC